MTQAVPRRLRRRIEGILMKWMPGMITCAEFEAFIVAYLDGELTPRQRRVFEIHLKICRECRDYLAAYQRTIELGKAAFGDPEAPLPDAVPEDLVKAVLDARNA